MHPVFLNEPLLLFFALKFGVEILDDFLGQAEDLAITLAAAPDLLLLLVNPASVGVRSGHVPSELLCPLEHALAELALEMRFLMAWLLRLCAWYFFGNFLRSDSHVLFLQSCVLSWHLALLGMALSCVARQAYRWL